MKRTALFAAILMASAAPAFAQQMTEPTVRVGGQSMFPSKTIVANALNSADHTTLVAAVKAAGLVDTLNGPGPFTVFAPTNAAFAMLPAGTVDNLVKPENKPMLTKILTYHVVAGNYDSNQAAVAYPGGQWHRDAEHCERRQAVADDERLDQHHGEGREGRSRRHHDLRCAPVERRDPGRRSRAASRSLIDRCGRPIPRGRPHSFPIVIPAQSPPSLSRGQALD
jgi:uncharacterized surface protein with fasciclin (FAS1) repeats